MAAVYSPCVWRDWHECERVSSTLALQFTDLVSFYITSSLIHIDERGEKAEPQLYYVLLQSY